MYCSKAVHALLVTLSTSLAGNDCYLGGLLEQGPELVIHHEEAVLAAMNEWSTQQHGASGLTQRCRESAVSMRDAEDQARPCQDKRVGDCQGCCSWECAHGALARQRPSCVRLRHSGLMLGQSLPARAPVPCLVARFWAFVEARRAAGAATACMWARRPCGAGLPQPFLRE